MVSTDTHMYTEARSASTVVAEQLVKNEALTEEIGNLLRDRQPQVIVTCARGSSDHAATYGKYLIETFAGVPTASFAPSVSSVYAAKQNMQSAVFLALSQSGKSPDLLASASAAKEAGAFVVALVNVVDSPLAELADQVVPLHAGPETSIAATKSYIATLVALAQLVAAWTQSDTLKQALSVLPGQLEDAWNLDWQQAVDALEAANNFFVIGRGVGLGIAQEAALKFKETAGLHAEAYSAAEVRHGPMAIVKHGFPVLIFTQDDGTRAGVDAVVEDFAARGAMVLVAGKSYDNAVNLPSLEGVAAATTPIVFIQSFYKMVNELAVVRGYDPDSPPHLRKVTETL
jgi:glucosamine--fructose-6-phosphate aminotransferase (isomerizing)